MEGVSAFLRATYPTSTPAFKEAFDAGSGCCWGEGQLWDLHPQARHAFPNRIASCPCKTKHLLLECKNDCA
jgi:hypothetical protein